MRPKRGSHAPGEFFYYNNWDFNVLGTVLERQVKNSVFRDFKQRIADPIGMQDFSVDDGAYVTGPDSVYPAYPVRMTARDMARFGLLFLRQGAWRGKQIIPAGWIRESTTSYSDTDPGGYGPGGYGYMWWLAVDGCSAGLPNVELPERSYSAQGYGGHAILVVEPYDLVIVHRINTDVPQGDNMWELGAILRYILAARSKDGTTISAAAAGPPLVSDKDRPLPGALVRRAAPTPAPQHRVVAEFGGKLALIGYDMPAELARGHKARGRLHFRVKERLAADYRVFVHVHRRCSMFNADHELLGTSMRQWQPGDYVTDTFEVDVDPTIPRGNYTLSVGLWPGGEGRRVKVTAGPNDGEDRVRLGTIQLR
jgi:hypothetical protein